jgi:hypothetical protein
LSGFADNRRNCADAGIERMMSAAGGRCFLQENELFMQETETQFLMAMVDWEPTFLMLGMGSLVFLAVLIISGDENLWCERNTEGW